jgi:hypothetical protein
VLLKKGMKREARIAFGKPMATDGSGKKNDTEIIFSPYFNLLTLNHAKQLFSNK